VKITFEVTQTDGTKHTVSTAYADILALEDKFDIDASELATRQRAKWMAFLAWNAMKRAGATKESFEKFTESLEDLSPSEAGQGNE
jgi:hypothetical protein